MWQGDFLHSPQMGFCVECELWLSALEDCRGHSVLVSVLHCDGMQSPAYSGETCFGQWFLRHAPHLLVTGTDHSHRGVMALLGRPLDYIWSQVKAKLLGPWVGDFLS